VSFGRSASVSFADDLDSDAGTKLDFGPHQIGDVFATTGAGEVALVGCDGPLTAGWGVSAVLEA
jgi:hypothetical protein